MSRPFCISIVGIFALVLLLAGCQSLFSRGQSGVVPLPVHVGKTGLEMSFLENLPPAQAFSSTPTTESIFPVAVKLANKGAADIIEGYLSVGLEKDYLELKDWNIEGQEAFHVGTSSENIAFSLPGRSALDPVGEEDVVALSVKALPLDTQSQTHTSTIIMTACYQYETLSAAEVCINPELFTTKPIEKICQHGVTSIRQGQGAPIAITGVETKMLPGPGVSILPQFLITLENVAKGQALNPRSVAQACSSLPLTHDDWNVLALSDLRFSRFSLAHGDFDCSPAPLRLRDGKATLRCTLKPNLLRKEEGAFKTTLFMALEYGYTFSVSKNIQIDRIVQ
ncbi:MAG: hypothetical protein Q7R76_05180 [Candidatus Woesearchaeota archaeon]|nr:hypothetical protein [Candidatus Woesearchaeota archaeon]